MQREHARGRHRAARQLLMVATVAAVLVTGVAFVTGPWWSRSVGFSGFYNVQKLAILWAGTGAVTACVLALLRSEDRLLRFGVVSLVQSLIAEVFSLILVAALPHHEAEHFALGQVIAQVAAMVLGLACRLPVLPRRRDLPMIGRGLRFSLPLVPALLSSFVMNASDRLVLHRLLGEGPTGGYQLAYSIGSIPILLLGVLGAAWLPRLFELTSTKGVVLAASRDAINRLLPAIVVGVAVGGPVMMRLWAPAKYRPDDLRWTLVLVVASVIPFAAGEAVNRSLMMAGKTTTVAVCNLLAAALNVAGNIVLDPRLGLVGAALATLVAYTALWLVLRLLAGHTTRIPPPPPRLLIALTTAGMLAIASAAVPVGGWFLILRTLTAALALATLIHSIRKIHHHNQTSKTTTSPT